ncbi:alpha/beta fold hydrolase [Mangrovicella endophytica]|uniref:alpha/beta fold hydrolase n=1 Tax=Mangrovicella endophytica TaxID=2066697 RepID=UPI001FE09259|nr:alpha/beta hydrolase [Mangrovicella endophytica]
MSTALRSDSVTASGITLAYDSFEADTAETILLIAGLGTQMIRWRDAFCCQLAARGYRVVRFDNRDTGGSTSFARHDGMDFATFASLLASGQRPEVAYTLGDMALDAVGLLDALSVDRAHLVGRSMGGMIAQIMASEHASRVLSLTSIMASSGNPDLPPPAPDALALMMRPAPDPARDRDGFIDAAVVFARRIAGSAYPLDEGAYRALIEAELRRGYVYGGVGRHVAAIVLSGDRRAGLSTIAAPTLVVHGTDDVLFPLACGEDTAAAISGANWLPIEGMGHDLPPALDGSIVDAIERTARRAMAERGVPGARPAVAPMPVK